MAFHMLGALNLHPDQKAVLEALQAKLHDRAGMGVTLVGNYLTVRWNDPKGQLCSVSMIVHAITPGHWFDEHYDVDPMEECDDK
jgi:hypothetical protein